MALHTLKEVTEINGFPVSVTLEDEKYVRVNHAANAIGFKIQDGPVKEKGVNGCQVDTMIEASRLILEGLNKNVPSHETSLAIKSLKEAEMWLEKRRINRTERGVEGTSAQ